MTDREYGERLESGSSSARLISEHRERYRFASQRLGDGIRVLDIACGSGYGAAFLATRQRHLVQVERDPGAAMEAARLRPPATIVVVGDAMAIPLQDGCVDACVSLETIEHVNDAEGMVAEVARVMAGGGLLVLSTPNRASREFPHDNPFHVREFTPEELDALISPYFHDLSWWGQYLRTARIGSAARTWLSHSRTAAALRRRLPSVLRNAGGSVLSGDVSVRALADPACDEPGTLIVVAERR